MNTYDSAWLDTNVIVRYLVDDDARLATLAATIIESDEARLISTAVLAECSFVLTSVYGRSRSEVMDALSELVQRENIQLPAIETGRILEALRLARDSGRVNIVDALLWAEAGSSGITTIYTFDHRFPADGVALARALNGSQQWARSNTLTPPTFDNFALERIIRLSAPMVELVYTAG